MAASITSTRMTMPAPPPYGVSSTCPPVSGVPSRKSTISICARVLRTWRCSTNQSNQCGKSVKTSISMSVAQEVAVDFDDLAFQVDLLDGVVDQRHQVTLVAHLQQRARRRIQHPLDSAQAGHLAREQVRDQVLVVLQLLLDEQDLAAQR